MPGRDSALRCPRPRGAGGTNRARICARLRSFRCLTLRSATGTAQRAIPTSFGVRVKLAAIPPKTAEKRACQRKWLRKWMLGRRRWSERRRNPMVGRRNWPERRRDSMESSRESSAGGQGQVCCLAPNRFCHRGAEARRINKMKQVPDAAASLWPILAADQSSANRYSKSIVVRLRAKPSSPSTSAIVRALLCCSSQIFSSTVPGAIRR